MSLKAELKSLVAQGKTKEAIAKFLLIAQQDTHSDIANSIVLLSGRFARLEKEDMLGVLARAEVNLESAQINHALLHLIDQLAETVAPAPAEQQTIAAANNITVSGNNNIIIQGVSGSTIHINPSK